MIPAVKAIPYPKATNPHPINLPFVFDSSSFAMTELPRKIIRLQVNTNIHKSVIIDVKCNILFHVPIYIKNTRRCISDIPHKEYSHILYRSKQYILWNFLPNMVVQSLQVRTNYTINP